MAHDPFQIDVFCLGAGGHGAIAQHYGVVGNLQRFFQMVGDVDDGHAAAGEVADNLEQHLHLGSAERGSWLVHDQNARIHRQRAGNFDDLLLTQTQLLHGRHRVDVFFQLGHQRAGLARLFGKIDTGGRAQLAPHKNVVANAEIGRQAQLLMDDGNAALARIDGGGKGDLIALQLDPAGGGLFNAGENLHQRGLAGAVFSEQRGDLARWISKLTPLSARVLP